MWFSRPGALSPLLVSLHPAQAVPCHSGPAGLLSVPGMLWTPFHPRAPTNIISSSQNFEPTSAPTLPSSTPIRSHFECHFPQETFPKSSGHKSALEPSLRLPHITPPFSALTTIVTSYFCHDLLTANLSRWSSFLRANSVYTLSTNTTPFLIEYPFIYF